jgi:hypothetical protein
MLDACDIRRMRAMQMAAGKAHRIEGQQLLLGHELALEGLVFRSAAVAPMNAVRLRESRDLVDPGRDPAVQRSKRWDELGCGGHRKFLESVRQTGRMTDGSVRANPSTAARYCQKMPNP